MTSLSLAAPSALEQLLSALDRLPAEAATRALAHDMARVCVEEGRAVSAPALIAAARAQLATTVALPFTSLMNATWDRPATHQAWQRALAEKQAELAHHQVQEKTSARRTWLTTVLGITSCAFAVLSACHHNIVGTGLGGGGELLFLWWALTCSHKDHKASAKVVSAQKILKNLSPWIASPQETVGALARAYMTQHTANGVPLLNGDKAAVQALNEKEAAYTEVNAWLSTSSADGASP